jgi:hypothetical protein
MINNIQGIVFAPDNFIFYPFQGINICNGFVVFAEDNYFGLSAETGSNKKEK